MGKEIEASANGYEFWLQAARQLAKAFEINREIAGIDGRFVNVQAVEPGGSGHLVGHMAANAGGRHNDRVAGLAGCHEGIEICHGARGHANFRIFCLENFGAEFGRNDFNLLDGFEAHFIFVAGIAERRTRAQACGQESFGARVHGIAGGIQVETFPLVDRAIACGQL